MQTATSLITALASSRAPDLPLKLLTQLNDAQIAKGPVDPMFSPNAASVQWRCTGQLWALQAVCGCHQPSHVTFYLSVMRQLILC
ncbi:MAG: hypothetical protein LPH21_04830 [Shewanella sp.]|nr:hypothetical protein [Shewanella sp.]